MEAKALLIKKIKEKTVAKKRMIEEANARTLAEMEKSAKAMAAMIDKRAKEKEAADKLQRE